MATYSSESKENALKQLLPPFNLSIKELSDKEGIPQATLYNWRQIKIQRGVAMPSTKSKTTDNWSAEQKLAAVVETYAMNMEELNKYCRSKGLYIGQIKSWKKSCLLGYTHDADNKKIETSQLKQSKKKIKSLEKELNRKEKALAEAAALLTLGKKFDALWADKEES